MSKGEKVYLAAWQFWDKRLTTDGVFPVLSVGSYNKKLSGTTTNYSIFKQATDVMVKCEERICTYTYLIIQVSPWNSVFLSGPKVLYRFSGCNFTKLLNCTRKSRESVW